jgi:hypothetical protein
MSFHLKTLVKLPIAGILVGYFSLLSNLLGVAKQKIDSPSGNKTRIVRWEIVKKVGPCDWINFFS